MSAYRRSDYNDWDKTSVCREIEGEIPFTYRALREHRKKRDEATADYIRLTYTHIASDTRRHLMYLLSLRALGQEREPWWESRDFLDRKYARLMRS